MRNFLLLIVLLVVIADQAFAQRNCGTMEYMESMLQKNPQIQNNMDAIENHTRAVIAAKRSKKGRSHARAEGIVTIPVVVHVVYSYGSENISKAQIASQIGVLNKDFRKLNSDIWKVPPEFSYLTADSQIEFVMATTDPNGNATDGITRTSTTKTSFSHSSNSVKFDVSGGKDAWPSDQYLNMWVCDISGGILGYAQFPGGPAATDGVVIDFRNFGNTNVVPPFNLGRTATHEVGHWLNLRHIWGDGGCGVDDGVADTPNQNGSNTGCPVNKFSCGTSDMYMNYMDYVDDFCMVMFSNGQKDRMRATFEPGGGRTSFATPSPKDKCGGSLGNFTASIINNSSVTHFYNGKITSAASVTQNTATVTFKSGTEVELNPGFVTNISGSGGFVVSSYNKESCQESTTANSASGVSASAAQKMSAPNNSSSNAKVLVPKKYIVYPNPNRGSFSIDFREKGEIIKSITVYDMFGVRILHKRYNRRLDVEQYSLLLVKSGLYKIAIRTANGVEYETLLVEF